MTLQFLNQQTAILVETTTTQTELTTEYVQGMIDKITATLTAWQQIKADMESVGCQFGVQQIEP